MAEILDTQQVKAYSAIRGEDERCLVARVWTPTDRKIFRVSPEFSKPATVRVYNGAATCGCKEQGGCVHIKAYMAYLDALAAEFAIAYPQWPSAESVR